MAGYQHFHLCTHEAVKCVLGRAHQRLAAYVEARVHQHRAAGASLEAVAALDEALRRFGPPEIFNTDQGRQFTGSEFIGRLKEAGVRISMDGKGRWLDIVFIERLWRSVKYEEVYLNAYDSVANSTSGLQRFFSFYNTTRTHQALGSRTPAEVYFPTSGLREAA